MCLIVFFALYFFFFILHSDCSECSFFCKVGVFAALLCSGLTTTVHLVSKPPDHFSNIVHHNCSSGMDSNFSCFSLFLIFLSYLTCSGHPAHFLTFYILSNIISYTCLFWPCFSMQGQSLASPRQVQTVAVIGLGLSAQASPFFLRLISFPTHFLCSFNGWQACAQPS